MLENLINIPNRLLVLISISILVFLLPSILKHTEILSLGLVVFACLRPNYVTYCMFVGPIKATRLMRAQRDLNPRPTAPQAAILSKLNYGPMLCLSVVEPYVMY